MNEPVATPIVQPEQSAEKKARPVSPSESIINDGLDLATYRNTHGRPYVADYFDIGDLYKTNKEVTQLVDDITTHLIDKTDGESIVYVVEQLLKEYGQSMNVKDNDAGLYKLKRVHKYIELKTKEANLKQMQEQVLADIEKLE